MASQAGLKAIVTGRVQGVFFRDFTRRKAISLGLSGRVRNMRDGSVEVIAEGERSALESLVEQLKTGPPAAEVAGVSVEWHEYRGGLAGFTVHE
jgi:acylphosphatase